MIRYRPGVGVVLLSKFNHIFVGKRIDSIKDAWQLPQGGIDDKETPENAALRELEEETNIPAKDVKIIAETKKWYSYQIPDNLKGKLWNGKYDGQSQKWFLLQHNGKDSQIKPTEVEHPEFEKWKWVPPEQVIDLAISFKKQVYQEIMEEFKHYIFTLQNK